MRHGTRYRHGDETAPRCSICRRMLTTFEATEAECYSCRETSRAKDDAASIYERTGRRVRWQDVRDFGPLYAYRAAESQSWLEEGT